MYVCIYIYTHINIYHCIYIYLYLYLDPRYGLRSSGRWSHCKGLYVMMIYVCICIYIYTHQHIPVVPRKGVAEVSTIGNLKESLVVVNQGWQSEATDGSTGD